MLPRRWSRAGLVAMLVVAACTSSGSEAAVAPEVPAGPSVPGPVVVVVFDELPLSTLMSDDGTINEERYPAFARLADASTWYRNASSNHHRTSRALPALLTGTVLIDDAELTHTDLPRNLFTLLAPHLPVERYEAMSDLCPADVCGPPSEAAREAGTSDISSTAPTSAPLEECGEPTGTVLCRWWERSDHERSPATQARILAAMGEQVDVTPRLHVAHVVVPHAPWTANPWGTTIMAGAPELVTDPGDPAYGWSGRLQYQRHSLQVGAADVALGSVLDDIEAAGVWEDATIVVVADHGTSLLPPVFGRDEVVPDNEQEVYRVPMFIKAAGQSAGEVVDEPAQAIDLLPTLADLLDVDHDWSFDGHSLLDGSAAASEPLVGEAIEPLFELVERHTAQFPEGEDWVGLAAVGDHAGLVGTPLADHEIGGASAMSWAPDFEEDFDSLPTADGRAPQLLTGGVVIPGGGRPPELVVAVNGTIAGTIGGYVQGEASWRFGSVLGPYLREGANEIVAYEVDGNTLRPLG